MPLWVGSSSGDSTNTDPIQLGLCVFVVTCCASEERAEKPKTTNINMIRPFLDGVCRVVFVVFVVFGTCGHMSVTRSLLKDLFLLFL